MHKAQHPEIMWGLGLEPDTATQIETWAGPGFCLRNLPADASGWLRGQEGQGQVAWIPQTVWQGLSKTRRRACRAEPGLRRILLLAGDAEPVEPEEVLAEGFATAVRAPLTRFSVRDALLRLRELDSLAADLRRRTEEVSLERELLARKSSHLSFLNRILSRATASLDAPTILAKVRTDLGQLLPVEVLCAVFFNREGQGPGLEAELFLHCHMAPQEQAAWEGVLLAEAERLGGLPVSGYRQIVLTQGKHLRQTPLPGSGRLLLLPLCAGEETFGCLALLSEKGLRLAKDQVQTVNAAVSHLSLALRNALLYRQVKSMADHDGLTKLANRRRFDERLAEETRRHGRYGQPLSLILLDMDHFKRVNDTCGHQTGDGVLRDFAALLSEGLRSTDLPARFGGEEFVVLLPHTDAEQAALLAERIRQRVARHVFGGDGTPLKLTVSAGVASLAPGQRCQELVALADQALYLAKNGGRNRVVSAAAEAEAVCPAPRPEAVAKARTAAPLRAAGMQ